MKITKVDVYQVNDPENPIWKPVFCRIHTDAGIYGDGEAAMAYGVGSFGAYGVTVDLARLVIGMNPLENEVIWSKLYKQTFWGQNGGGVFSAGMSAIDMALWDIRGKYYKAPLYELLGGKYRDSLRTYASQLQFRWEPKMGACRSNEDYAAAARRAVGQGYDAIKVDFFTYKNGEGSYTDDERTTLLDQKTLKTIVGRVAAVREAVGPDVDIIMENHSFLDALSAVQLGRAVRDYRIFFFEEPNTPDPKTAKYIAENLDIPIASGERIYTRWQYAKYLENSSLQIIQPDLGTCGGITEAKKICDMAYPYDVAVQIHSCGSPLCLAAALQVEAAIPHFIIHEHHQAYLCPFNKKLCIYDYQPENGYSKVPELPGIGNEVSDFVLNQETHTAIEGTGTLWSM